MRNFAALCVVCVLGCGTVKDPATDPAPHLDSSTSIDSPGARTLVSIAITGSGKIHTGDMAIGATGAATPTRTISGSATTLSGPLASFMY